MSALALERIAFLHIPKTAGSSLTQALASHWGRVMILTRAEELDELDDKRALALTLIAGHFYAYQLQHPVFAGFTPLTVLRDPFSRLLSSYKFARMCAAQGLPLTPAMTYASRVPFQEYAFSGIAAADRHAQLYILGLELGQDARITPLGDLLQTAQERLERMRVGVTEALGPFLEHLFTEAGAAGMPPLEHLVASSERDMEGGLTAAQRQALHEVLAPDYALHEHARVLMLRQLEQARPIPA